MYAIMRTEKHHTMGEIAALGKHNERTRDTPNADPERLGENVRLVGSGDWVADAQARLAEATNPHFRPDAIRGVEVFMGVSPEFKNTATEADWRAWVERSMGWLTDTFRDPRNVVAAVWHRDELTPHIQALVVPLREDNGRLSYEHYLGGSKYRLSELQTAYAEAVRDLGLERGVQGSQATHQDVQRWYAKVTEPTPAPEIVKRDIEIERPSRLTLDPERWAMEQREKVVERIAPALDAALVKAQHYEEQAAQAEANVAVLQQRVREVERERDTLQRDYKALVAQARQLDLRDTIQTLGGAQDRYDTHKWRVNDEHISINGERFYNHDQQKGGGGSIDLVMHVTGYTFKQAVAYLNHEAGPELAVAAAAQHGARERMAQGQEIVERGERAPFIQPQADEDRWPQVRAYLVEQRQLPAGLVDELHERGTIYADGRANAVFLRTNEEGQAVGASLRGTLPGSEFQGLAYGSRRDEGHFSFTIGTPERYSAPQYHITESPIDALSRAALIQRAGERGEYVFLSNDGHGELPKRQIEEGLARQALVHCGFDNDAGGNKLWQQVKEAYPRAEAIVRERPPSGAKDWNDALRAVQGRAEGQSQGQGQEDDRAPSRGRGRAQEYDNPSRG
jgi:hypothetical protein